MVDREARARKRRRVNIFVPTASMGDIAFLLIIFFMLTSKFMQESHIEYKDAYSPDIVPLEDISYSVIVDAHGEIWLQGQPCGSAEDLRSAVERLAGDKKDVVVMLKVDKDAVESQYGEVLKSLGNAGVRVAMIGAKSNSY